MHWLLRIVILNTTIGVIELVYAVEGSYFVPAIYAKGLSYYGTMLLAVSPVLGLLCQNLLGSTSDRCNCRWGKRKPFLLLFTISGACGLALFPFTEGVAAKFATSRGVSRRVIVIILTVISTTLCDFSAGSLLTINKAFASDVTSQSERQQEYSFTISCVWMSIGAVVGYFMGSFSWFSTFSDQIITVCLAAMMINVFFNMLPLCFVSDNKTKESGEHIIGKETVGMESEENYQKCEITPLISNDGTREGRDIKCTCSWSLLTPLSFMWYMSKAVWILFFATLFATLAIDSQIFFLTDYVGEIMYNGNIKAPLNSSAYNDYVSGVKAGSRALGISAISSILVSVLFQTIIKRITKKVLFILAFVAVMLQSGALIVYPHTILLYILAPIIYCSLVILLNLPFTFVSQFERKDLLRREDLLFNEDVTGRASATLTVAILSGQAAAQLINGPLKHCFGSAETLMIVVCISSFVGAIIACFVKA